MRSLTYLYRTMGPAKTGSDIAPAITPKPSAEARPPAESHQPALKAPAAPKVLSDLR